MKGLFEKYTNKYFYYITLSVCDIWNLDILRFVIPGFCLSEHYTTTSVLFVELGTAFYPVVLIVLTWVLIEMHACNVRPIVFLWKPFHKCFSTLRRTWDPKSSIITAFATFHLLFSFKVCFLVSSFFWTLKIKLTGPNGTRFEKVLYNQQNVKSTDYYRQPFFVPAILLYTTFGIMPSVLLCVYPTKFCKCVRQRVCSGRQRSFLFTFMESFQGHYKNGTSGSYDYRSASAAGFVLRAVTWCFLNRVDAWVLSLVTLRIALILTAASLLYAYLRPCKKHYMNVVESMLYITTAALQFYMHRIANRTLRSGDYTHSIVFVFIVIYKILHVIGVVNKLESLKTNFKRCIFRQRGDSEAAVRNTDPHRLTHPTEYPPLLQNQQQQRQ